MCKQLGIRSSVEGVLITLHYQYPLSFYLVCNNLYFYNSIFVAVDSPMAYSVPRLGKEYPLNVVEETVMREVHKLVDNWPTAEQMKAVLMFLSGKDLFFTLPTDGGKSVHFSCLPSVFDELQMLSGSVFCTIQW